MPKGANQKLKLYYLACIFNELTDEEHSLTMQQIIEELAKREVTAERKSIYDDLNYLDEIGMEIIHEQIGKEHFYHIGSRRFELPELKLLVDAVQSSKFITAKKSNELIEKLESFASKYEAGKLRRQVYVQNRIKTMNESIYYNVDSINTAIQENHRIKFQYYNWNVKKEEELRHDGAFYDISPWALAWDDENYYLIGYDSEAGLTKHFRVDKMRRITVTQEPRDGRKEFEHFDPAEYARRNFGMFSGEATNVRLEIDNSMAGVIIDRFGKDVTFIPVDDEHSSVAVSVAMSDAFIGWVFGLGPKVRIAGPEDVVKAVREKAQKFADLYK